jgi:nucleotide-binding universal stress UspA family protein
MGVWVEPLRDRGVAVSTVIVEDIHPVAAIANTAMQRSAQLIVVGTHGLGGFSKMRLGGVAVQLVHHLGLPVVLVPPATTEGPQ